MWIVFETKIATLFVVYLWDYFLDFLLDYNFVSKKNLRILQNFCVEESRHKEIIFFWKDQQSVSNIVIWNLCKVYFKIVES